MFWNSFIYFLSDAHDNEAAYNMKKIEYTVYELACGLDDCQKKTQGIYVGFCVGKLSNQNKLANSFAHSQSCCFLT